MLTLDEQERSRLWKQVVEQIERYTNSVDDAPVAPQDSMGTIVDSLKSFDFASGRTPEEVIQFAVTQMSRNQVHTPSPRYFGLFNPNPATMSIYADALVAAFNPQLAAASHNPFAVATERHLVRTFGKMFGLPEARTAGTFTSGGAEANHTAMLCALAHRFPQVRQKGLRSLSAQPVAYVSSEAHHSLAKAGRMCGLGTDAVREVPVDQQLRMDVNALEKMVKADKAAGMEPFLIVGTAGTTNAGAIDPLSKIADLAERYHIWYHVDAAWGGAAMLVRELKPALAGIERADSITFDCHKWLSVPMSAGMFLTRHVDVQDRAFRIAADYMPKQDDAEEALPDPYATSIQWSRRFIGLKVLMALAVAGFNGYEEVLRHQKQMGELLRERLQSAGWRVVNDTPLPIVCFQGAMPAEQTPEYLQKIAAAVIEANGGWISTTRVGQGRHVLRACITNYRTEEKDIAALMAALEAARKQSAVAVTAS